MKTYKMNFMYISPRTDREFIITVKAKFVVCDKCDGHGTQLIDGLRGVAFSASEMEPDFKEAYFRGDYDERCGRCNGERVVLAPDEDAMTKRQRLLWDKTQDRWSEFERESAIERQRRERGIQW